MSELEDDDHLESLVKQHKIGHVMMPPVEKCKFTESNLAHVDLDQVSVYLYLHGVCGWSENQLRDYKLDNGYKLFLDRHISQVTVSCNIRINMAL